jgi:hypothetical protein
MLHNLAEWVEFAQGSDVFISHKATVGAGLGYTYHCSHINEDEALLLIRANPQ